MSKYLLRPGDRLRTTDEERQYYGRVYPGGYRHDVWPDHVERVEASVALIRKYSSQIRTAADLSCGDGAILRKLLVSDLDLAWFGDLNGVNLGWVDDLPATAGEVMTIPPGPLPDSLRELPVNEGVDLFVLSETLEHMPDPERVLNAISNWAGYLFLSTPLSEPVGSGNLEHYWGWSDTDIHDLLMDNGWTPLEKQLLKPVSTQHMDDPYTFQLWLARSVNE